MAKLRVGDRVRWVSSVPNYKLSGTVLRIVSAPIGNHDQTLEYEVDFGIMKAFFYEEQLELDEGEN
jgi:hypothetical protein